MATGHRVDGLIIISLSPTDDDVGRWAGADVPVVLLDTSHLALHRVIVDDVAGGYLATEHLIGLGHHKIAFIGDPVHTAFNFTSSRHRLEGLRHALADHGITFRPEYHQTGEHGQETARILTHTLMALEDPPSAVFAASDTQAFGVMQAARERGIRVPEDLSVIGFDDIEMAEYLNLTTIRQPLFDSGQRGIQLLLESMEDPDGPVMCEELPVELIVRSTSAPPM